MKPGDVKISFDGMSKFKEAIDAIRVNEVLVGVPASAANRNSDTPMNNATIGYINENGSDIAHIPPRPHLVPGVEKVVPQITEEFKKAAMLAFTNPSESLNRLSRAGIIASNSVKKVITDQEGFAEPSIFTLMQRERDGFKGDKALIVTGQYRNSITYVVEKKK